MKDVPVSVVMTTFMPPGQEAQRLERACAAAYSWARNITYDDPLQLIIEDDNSAFDVQPIVEAARNGIGFDNIVYERGAGGVGASLNRGQAIAWQTSPITLYAVDDWELMQPFDITPWVQLLQQREDVGCVRLGPPHPGIGGVIEAMTPNWQGWALRLQPGIGIVAGHRPALWHQKFFDAVGPWKENVTALECEREMNDRWNAFALREWGRPPGIVYALPHPWYHLQPHEGDISMSERQP